MVNARYKPQHRQTATAARDSKSRRKPPRCETGFRSGARTACTRHCTQRGKTRSQRRRRPSAISQRGLTAGRPVSRIHSGSGDGADLLVAGILAPISQTNSRFGAAVKWWPTDDGGIRVARRFRSAAFLSVCLVAAAPLNGSEAASSDGRTEVTQGIVVSVSAPASEVGLAVLRGGGNAVDAAVATAFALAVTWPAAGNIGGGGFMMVHPAAGQHRCVSSTGKRPRRRPTSGCWRSISLRWASGVRDARHGRRIGVGASDLREEALAGSRAARRPTGAGGGHGQRAVGLVPEQHPL